MRTISGTVKSTQTQWLPVLSNILPPELRRKKAASSILEEIKNKTDLPIHKDVFLHPDKRLKSRHPIWSDAIGQETPQELWKKHWKESGVKNSFLIDDPNIKPPGFELPRPIWTTLNRIRSDQGRCKYLLYKWGFTDTPACTCGAEQTVKHIVQECPQTKFEGGIGSIHGCDSEAVDWMRELNVRL
jgi:hypothetical protein